MAHWWTNYPWRMVQTNMRQIDMEDIDAKQFVEDLKQFDANAVMINTGGIIASYHTNVEDHFESEYLHGDSLEKVMNACHDAGIKVMARMDFSKIRRPVYEKHPDWAYIDPKGNICDYNGDVHACICGDYQQKKAFEIIEEVCCTLPVDGLFINMGGFQVTDYSYNYHGICHCSSCKRKFKEMYNLDLPDKEDMDNPVYRKYVLFKNKIIADYMSRLEKTIHAINPEIAIDKIDFTRMESNTEYKRPLPYWQYSGSSNTRALRGMDGKMVSSNTSVDFMGFFYRHIAVNGEEQELRLWQDLANFGGVDYYLIGRLDNHEDKSAYPHVKNVFHFAKEHQQDYTSITSCADVLLIRGDQWGMDPEERGWVRALTESHILFDEVLTAKIPRDADFSKYKAVILPEMKRIPGWLASSLDNFAKNGGAVIASGSCGIYDDNYDESTKYPLECMGIKGMPFVRNDMTSAMLHVEDRDLSAFSSYDNDRLIYFGDLFAYSEYSPESRGYFKLIPPHHIGPPERCYYTQITEIPGINVHSYGRGIGVHIPWQCGKCFYRDGYDNTFRFMKELLVNIAHITPVCDASVTPMVEVAAGKNSSHMLIQLVNNTGHFGTSYLPPVKLSNITVSIPCSEAPKYVVNQANGTQIPFSWENGVITVTADEVNHFYGMKAVF